MTAEEREELKAMIAEAVRECGGTPPIYTIESLARLLGTSEQTIYKLTSNKEISFFTVGSTKGIRFTQAQVDEYIASRNKASKRDIARKAVLHTLQHQ